MGDACLLGKALQALVTPELLPRFLVTASEFTLNNMFGHVTATHTLSLLASDKC